MIVQSQNTVTASDMCRQGQEVRSGLEQTAQDCKMLGKWSVHYTCQLALALIGQPFPQKCQRRTYSAGNAETVSFSVRNGLCQQGLGSLPGGRWRHDRLAHGSLFTTWSRSLCNSNLATWFLGRLPGLAQSSPINHLEMSGSDDMSELMLPCELLWLWGTTTAFNSTQLDKRSAQLPMCHSLGSPPLERSQGPFPLIATRVNQGCSSPLGPHYFFRTYFPR